MRVYEIIDCSLDVDISITHIFLISFPYFILYFMFYPNKLFLAGPKTTGLNSERVSNDSINSNTMNKKSDGTTTTVSSITLDPTTKTIITNLLSGSQESSLPVTLDNVEYSKRPLLPIACEGNVYTPSEGVCNHNLVINLLKESKFLLNEKNLKKEDRLSVVSAFQVVRNKVDGAYIQLNLKGGGADRILQNYQEEAPTICFILDKWKNNPDTSSGDKLLIYPPGGQTGLHIDQDKSYRTNLHFGIGKSLVLCKGKGATTSIECDKLICETNNDYHIYEGTNKMFCESSICYHKGMLTGKSAGFTLVTNPANKEIALDRPRLLSRIFLEWIAFVQDDSKDSDSKSQSQDVEEDSRLLKVDVGAYLEEQQKNPKKRLWMTDEEKEVKNAVSKQKYETSTKGLLHTDKKLKCPRLDVKKPNTDYVSVISPNDVLLSAGGRSNTNAGNNKLRALIDTGIHKYLSVKNKTMVDKKTGKRQLPANRQMMVDEILTQVSNNDGQFLVKCTMVGAEVGAEVFEVQDDIDTKRKFVKASIKTILTKWKNDRKN